MPRDMSHRVSAAMIVACFSVPLAVMAEEAPAFQTPVRTMGDRAFVRYVDGEPGADITKNIQKALDACRANGGGTVMLPPGNYTVTNTIHLAGSISRFPKGGPSGIRLTGPGGAESTVINYRGPENSVVLDMPAPWGCTVANLTIDADNTPGVVGIHYRGGYDRETNGGKNNLFENLILRRMDVGIHIGDPFGPDLVGSTFRSLWIMYVRIGVLAEGANVTGMAFYNLSVTTWNEAGIKIVGHSARRLRESPDDLIPDDEFPGEPAVVMDAITGEEIFQKDVPEYVLKRHHLFTGVYRGYGPFVWAGGGAPDITIYNLNCHSADPSTWVIDSNWGNVRVYSARIEGPAGIFRRTGTLPGLRFADVLMDVNATSPGGMTGNVIEYAGQGPLYMIGGVYEGNIALGQETILYNMGAKFFEHREKTPGLVPKDYVIPEGSKAVRTGEERIFPGRRGLHDVVDIPLPRNIGFTQLPGTRGMQVHEMHPATTLSVVVPAGKSAVWVPLEGTAFQSDTDYRVVATPGFNAGGVWVSNKQRDGFDLNVERAPEGDAAVDVLVQRRPYRKQAEKQVRFER